MLSEQVMTPAGSSADPYGESDFHYLSLTHPPTLSQTAASKVVVVRSNDAVCSLTINTEKQTFRGHDIFAGSLHAWRIPGARIVLITNLSLTMQGTRSIKHAYTWPASLGGGGG